VFLAWEGFKKDGLRERLEAASGQAVQDAEDNEAGQAVGRPT